MNINCLWNDRGCRTRWVRPSSSYNNDLIHNTIWRVYNCACLNCLCKRRSLIFLSRNCKYYYSYSVCYHQESLHELLKLGRFAGVSWVETDGWMQTHTHARARARTHVHPGENWHCLDNKGIMTGDRRYFWHKLSGQNVQKKSTKTFSITNNTSIQRHAYVGPNMVLRYFAFLL